MKRREKRRGKEREEEGNGDVEEEEGNEEGVMGRRRGEREDKDNKKRERKGR